MNISKIILRNFKSHNETSLDLKPFSVIAGFPRLGKTSFLEAIEYVLLGTVNNSSRLDHIISKGSSRKDFEVEIEGVIGDKPFKLIRSRELHNDSPLTRITFNDESLTQKKLEAELGLNNFTIFGLVSGLFRQLDNSKRRQLLTDLIRSKIEITRESTLTEDEKSHISSLGFDSSERSLEKAKKELKDEDELRNVISGRLEEKKSQGIAKTKELTDHQNIKETLVKEKEEIEKLKPLEKTFDLSKIEELEKSRDNLKESISRQDSQIRILESQISDTSEAICQTCSQKLPKKRIDEIKNKNNSLTKEISKVKLDKSENEKLLKIADDNIAQFKSQREEKENYDKEVSEHNSKFKGLQYKMNTWLEKETSLKKEVEQIKAQYIELETKSHNENKISELKQIISILADIPKRIADKVKDELSQYLPANITIELSRFNKIGNEEKGVYIKFSDKDEVQLSTSEQMELDLSLSKLFNELGEGLNMILIDRLESWNGLIDEKNYQHICTKVSDSENITVSN